MPEEAAGKRSLSKEQKIGFVLLLCFAILTVGLGILQIRNNMFAPFALNNSVPPDLKDKVNDQLALQYRDTDLEGLSDFDELYVYGTSPYLADTDSDGLTDKQEIESGKDPICAEGKTCVAEEVAATTSTPTAAGGVQNPGEPPVDFNKLLNDPAELRKVLSSSGMDKKILDSYTDQQLMQMVGDTMQAVSTTKK
jgi:hypothetical protein